MLKSGRLYYTSRGFDLLTSLGRKKTINKSHGIKLRNNLHSSSFPLLHLWKILHNRFQATFSSQIDLCSPWLRYLAILGMSHLSFNLLMVGSHHNNGHCDYDGFNLKCWILRCMCRYSNTTVIWTPIFEWYMVRWDSKNVHQRYMCLKMNGLRIENMQTILNWTVKVIVRTYMTTVLWVWIRFSYERQKLWGKWVWICQSSHTNYVFRIPYEKDADVKVCCISKKWRTQKLNARLPLKSFLLRRDRFDLWPLRMREKKHEIPTYVQLMIAPPQP